MKKYSKSRYLSKPPFHGRFCLTDPPFTLGFKHTDFKGDRLYRGGSVFGNQPVSGGCKAKNGSRELEANP